MANPNENSNKSYKEAAGEFYNRQYENWVPWAEDQYLKWFTKDNKASYATKQQLDQTKITGNSQVDNLQDGVNNLVAGQVGKGGLAQPIGDMASKEGVNRMERGGKDEHGNDIGSTGGLADGVKGGAEGIAGGVTGGAKNVGGAVGGLFGGGGDKK